MLYAILNEEKEVKTYLTEKELYMADELYQSAYTKLKITKELQIYILELGQCQLIADAEDREYTIEDKSLFKEMQIQLDDGLPTMPDTIKSLGEEVASLKLDLINMKGGN